MFEHFQQQRRAGLVVGIVAGLVVGLSLGGLWPQTPLHAVATHGQATCAIATGPLDDHVEAVYFLDFITGDLRAAALNISTMKFGALYQHNVLQDLQLIGVTNPKFMIVTGLADLRRGPSRLRPSRAAVYVAEATTGAMAAYALPWAPGAQAANVPTGGGFLLLDRARFRTVAIRNQ